MRCAADYGAEILERRLLLTTFTPAQIRAAYGVDQISLGGTTGDGSGQTIAIIIPYDDSTDITDANSFSSMYSTPSLTLPAFNGSGGPMLTVLNQRGGSRPLNINTGVDPTKLANWQNEQSLDIEWAHAIAPQANIVVIEADTDSDVTCLPRMSKLPDFQESASSQTVGRKRNHRRRRRRRTTGTSYTRV